MSVLVIIYVEHARDRAFVKENTKLLSNVLSKVVNFKLSQYMKSSHILFNLQ